MKRFITYDLGYTLQIFAVILLFGYPGCSSRQEEKNTNRPGQSIEKNSAPQANMKGITGADSLIILNQWNPLATEYSFFTGSRK